MCDGEDIFVNSIGGIDCRPHGRATYKVCCLNFAIVNRTIEEDAGLRKKKSRAEELASAGASQCVHFAHGRFPKGEQLPLNWVKLESWGCVVDDTR